MIRSYIEVVCIVSNNINARMITILIEQKRLEWNSLCELVDRFDYI